MGLQCTSASAAPELNASDDGADICSIHVRYTSYVRPLYVLYTHLGIIGERRRRALLAVNLCREAPDRVPRCCRHLERLQGRVVEPDRTLGVLVIAGTLGVFVIAGTLGK